MIKDTKKRLLLIIEVASFIVFILLCMGLFYLVGSKNKEAKEVINKDINFSYFIDESLNMSVSIPLESREMIKIYDSVQSLEFGSVETVCFAGSEYYLEYDENKLYLNETCGTTVYNDEIYSITSGGEKVFELLKEKVKGLNNVYLFEYNQENQKSSLIDLSEEDKNSIREIWEKSEKNSVSLNLSLKVKNVLYIDGDLIGIQNLNDYVSYNCKYAGNFITLNQEMRTIIERYIGSECCPCCTDLEPGEECVSTCCPCV